MKFLIKKLKVDSGIQKKIQIFKFTGLELQNLNM